MSFDGHVLCQRMLIGPCALTTLGAATVAAVATAAPFRNLRRVVALDSCSVAMGIALLGWINLPCGILGAAWVYEPSGRVPIPVVQVVGGAIAPHKARIVSPHRPNSENHYQNDRLDSVDARPQGASAGR